MPTLKHNGTSRPDVEHRANPSGTTKVSEEVAFESLKTAIRIALIASEVRAALVGVREQQDFSLQNVRRQLGLSLWHLELLCVRLRDSLGTVEWLLHKLSVHALTCELNGDLEQAGITLAMSRIVAGEAAVYDRPTFASPICAETWVQSSPAEQMKIDHPRR